MASTISPAWAEEIAARYAYPESEVEKILKTVTTCTKLYNTCYTNLQRKSAMYHNTAARNNMCDLGATLDMFKYGHTVRKDLYQQLLAIAAKVELDMQERIDNPSE